ncbi:MAG: AbrB/MazE/SpoVT family DNA-binding domain-containing protein [Synergistaceae bacterium]|nr:AbrB/MazE/SpoVT family DNA-binding domain-containing protein [Synergistaceae bacterium]
MPELITVSDKGQITIPLQFREKLMLQAGDKMYCEIVDGAFICRRPVDFFSLRGCLGKKKLPENEEDLFIEAVAEHVMENS